MKDSRSYLRRIAERQGAPGMPNLMPPRHLFRPALLPPAGLEVEPLALEIPRTAVASVVDHPRMLHPRPVETRSAPPPVRLSPEQPITDASQTRELLGVIDPSPPMHVQARVDAGAMPRSAAPMPTGFVGRSQQSRFVPAASVDASVIGSPTPTAQPRHELENEGPLSAPPLRSRWPKSTTDAPPMVVPSQTAGRAAAVPEAPAPVSAPSAERIVHLAMPVAVPQTAPPTGSSNKRGSPPPDITDDNQEPRNALQPPPRGLPARPAAPVPPLSPQQRRTFVSQPATPATGLSIGTLEVRVVAPAAATIASHPASAPRDVAPRPALARGFPSFGIIQS
jgi:hypothetical protein